MTAVEKKRKKPVRKQEAAAELVSPVAGDIIPPPADVDYPPVPVPSDIPLQKPTVLELPPDPERRGTGGFIHEFRAKREKGRIGRAVGLAIGVVSTVAAVTGIIAAAVINAEQRERRKKKKKKKK